MHNACTEYYRRVTAVVLLPADTESKCFVLHHRHRDGFVAWLAEKVGRHQRTADVQPAPGNSVSQLTPQCSVTCDESITVPVVSLASHSCAL